MIMNLKDFREGLNRCVGIVNAQGNSDTLKSFYLKPDMESKKVYLAGSDGIIYFLDKIPFEPQEGDTEDVIILPSEKLHPISKRTGELIQITNAGSQAIVEVDSKKWTLIKKSDDYLDDVPFDCFDLKTFDDEFSANDFLFVLERLAVNISNPSDPNPRFKQLFMDGEKTYSVNSTFGTIVQYPSRKQYVFSEKVVKCLRDVLKGYSGVIKFAYADKDLKVVIRTSTAVFVFKNTSVGDPVNIDTLESAELENAVIVDKAELADLVASAKIGAGDNHIDINIEVTDDIDDDTKKHVVLMNVQSEDAGSGLFEGTIECVNSDRTLKSEDVSTQIEETTFGVALDNLEQAVNIVKSEFVILRYSTTGNSYLSVSDQEKFYRSILAVQ